MSRKSKNILENYTFGITSLSAQVRVSSLCHGLALDYAGMPRQGCVNQNLKLNLLNIVKKLLQMD